MALTQPSPLLGMKCSTREIKSQPPSSWTWDHDCEYTRKQVGIKVLTVLSKVASVGRWQEYLRASPGDGSSGSCNSRWSASSTAHTAIHCMHVNHGRSIEWMILGILESQRGFNNNNNNNNNNQQQQQQPTTTTTTTTTPSGPPKKKDLSK